MHNEMPPYSVDISEDFIWEDFILEEEFCAEVISKL